MNPNTEPQFDEPKCRKYEFEMANCEAEHYRKKNLNLDY